MFRLEEPSINRKEEATDYIEEHYLYDSPVNGSGKLNKYVNNYEEWLIRLEDLKNIDPSKGNVPEHTYFLIREEDDKIIGMINIRLALNERLKKCGGHIGYGIRPTERGNGYNKINLYLGLQVCQSYGLDKVILDADINNLASWKTMEALSGKRIDSYHSDEKNIDCYRYEIDVEKSLKENENMYQKQIKR